MKRFLKDILIYTVIVECLLALIIAFQPLMVQGLRYDLSRHKLIINSLSANAKQPDIIVFGNSLSMLGVNTKQISEAIPSHPLIYNLSSVDQGIVEGAYFISAVHQHTSAVVQCLDFSTFSLESLDLQEENAISMIMNGYSIDSTTKAILRETNPFFDKSKLVVAFEARNTVRSSLHNVLRKYLDNEKFANNFHDRYFPHVYLQERHPDYPNISQFAEEPELKIVDTILALASRINSFLNKKGIRYHIVLMPLNQDIYKMDDSVCNEYLEKVKTKLPGIDILDLSRKLTQEHFYDAIHPNKKGAAVISAMVADHLRGY